jgi:rare lipoprotein A
MFGRKMLVRSPLAVAPESPPASPPEIPAAPTPPEPVSPPPSAAPNDATVERGRVSLYGDEFAGKKTASGDVFDPDGLTMAHRSLPFGTRVRVTNTENHRSVDVTVNDRGPFVAGRIADLSLGAARQIGMVAHGVVEATLEVLRLGSGRAP